MEAPTACVAVGEFLEGQTAGVIAGLGCGNCLAHALQTAAEHLCAMPKIAEVHKPRARGDRLGEWRVTLQRGHLGEEVRHVTVDHLGAQPLLDDCLLATAAKHSAK